jgi:glycosyltransferase involved in cell wall biosynthesis
VRILIASDHYPPFIGGAQRQTWLIAHELERREHRVVVATVWQDRTPAREDDHGVRVRRLKQLRTVAPLVRGPARRRHQPPFPDPVTVLELRRLIDRFGPDVIHAAGWFSYSCAAALLGRDVPLVVSARDYGFSCANTTLMQGDQLCSGPGLRKCMACAGEYYGVPRGWAAATGVLGFRPLIKRKTAVLHSVSQFVDMVMRRDLMDGEAIARTPLEVIPSFRFEDEAPAKGNDDILRGLPERPFILFVGALRRVKGIQTLLAAYRRLADSPPLVLLGTREVDTPRDLPPKVVVIEGLPNWAVLEAWDRSLFGVFPSLWPEPFGSVVHEAMSRGKAVVGTTPGGHADMIEHERTGLLVPAGDAEALEQAMRTLIDDAALRERLGTGGRARARRFTADVVVPQYERLYARAIRAARAPAPIASTG